MNTIVDGAQCRENQHRCAVVALAQRADDGQAIEIGQLAIRDDHVVVAARRLGESVASIGAVIDGVTAVTQSLDEIFGSFEIVFDEKQMHDRGIPRR